MFVNWAFYISIVVATLYYTAPAPHESWAETYISPRYYGAVRLTIPIASGSLALDVYILLCIKSPRIILQPTLTHIRLPMFGIYNLRLSTRKKLGIMIIFATGFA